jgi:methyltransferase
VVGAVPLDASTAGVALVLAVVLLTMLLELRISLANERLLHARGAVEFADAVYGLMRWAYPGVFVLMAAEGAWIGRSLDGFDDAGAATYEDGKALKVWAMRTLGERWTYKVIVIPNAPLVTGGPYAFLQHPNYVGVLGELIGMALMMRALVTGPVGTLFFVELLRRRIAAEEKALGLRI